jgi:hypothetical protein
VRYNTCTPAPCTTLDANKEHACWNIGVIALADGIKDMRTMTSLDLASNDLGAEGAKIVAKAIKVTNYNYVYTCDNFDTIFMSI